MALTRCGLSVQYGSRLYLFRLYFLDYIWCKC